MLYVQVVKPLPIVYVKYCYRETSWPISSLWSSDTVQETIYAGDAQSQKKEAGHSRRYSGWDYSCQVSPPLRIHCWISTRKYLQPYLPKLFQWVAGDLHGSLRMTNPCSLHQSTIDFSKSTIPTWKNYASFGYHIIPQIFNILIQVDPREKIHEARFSNAFFCDDAIQSIVIRRASNYWKLNVCLNRARS